MDECCCPGFLLARNALKSVSVLAIFNQIEGKSLLDKLEASMQKQMSLRLQPRVKETYIYINISQYKSCL